MKKKENKIFFWRGAEAEVNEKVFEGKKLLSKKRVPKGYRDQELDLGIRKTRTRAEAKLIREASLVINVPKIFLVDETKGEIIMEFVKGKQLKEEIKKNNSYCVEVGKNIRALHNIGVIHGDLTTSNIIVADISKETMARIQKRGKLFFIDFGLGYFSKKLEDKATDLVVFKKTFNATHSTIKKGWELVMQGYKPEKDLIERMKLIEKRARYH
jgi:Kae1-associated kinase Bud32